MNPRDDAVHLAELKVRCRDLEGVRRWADREAVFGEEAVQRDTYFRADQGRLKLRETEGRPALLVFYLREDVPGPKESRVRLAEVPDGEPVRRLLEEALGVRAVVGKRRRIYRWGRVQVHLDRVEGLGSFVEFERPLAAGEGADVAQAEFRELREALGIRDGDLVAGSYVDLLEGASEPPAGRGTGRRG